MFDEDRKRRIPIAAGVEEQSPAPDNGAAPGREEQQPTLAELNEQLRAEVEEERDGRLRALAELQNFRRRFEQEQAQRSRFACEGLLTDLIPVLDHFGMATEAAEATDETRIFCKGYEMILQQLRDALARHGLEEIPAVAGMFFDPEYHDAVERVEINSPCEGTVMRIVRKGYKLRDRVLRAVQVAVAVPPEE